MDTYYCYRFPSLCFFYGQMWPFRNLISCPVSQESLCLFDQLQFAVFYKYYFGTFSLFFFMVLKAENAFVKRRKKWLHNITFHRENYLWMVQGSFYKSSILFPLMLTQTQKTFSPLLFFSVAIKTFILSPHFTHKITYIPQRRPKFFTMWKDKA